MVDANAVVLTTENCYAGLTGQDYIRDLALSGQIPMELLQGCHVSAWLVALDSSTELALKTSGLSAYPVRHESRLCAKREHIRDSLGD